MIIYVWIGLIILAFLVEAAVPGLVAIWFVPAGIVALILCLLSVPLEIQVVAFLLIALLCILLARRFFKKHMEQKTAKTNIDAIVGVRCLVTEHVENLAGLGQVKVNGMYWAARSYDDDVTFEPGDEVTVLAIEGVKLIIR